MTAKIPTAIPHKNVYCYYSQHSKILHLVVTSILSFNMHPATEEWVWGMGDKNELYLSSFVYWACPSWLSSCLCPPACVLVVKHITHSCSRKDILEATMYYSIMAAR